MKSATDVPNATTGIPKRGKGHGNAEPTITERAPLSTLYHACVQLAAGRRAELRPRIGRDLSDSAPRGYLHPYCVALAALGTERDARSLSDYLSMSLALTEQDERHCQTTAMAALLYLDHRLGTDHAAPFLAPAGPWARWPGSSEVSLDEAQREITSEVAFAAGADPRIRSTLRRREEPAYDGK